MTGSRRVFLKSAAAATAVCLLPRQSKAEEPERDYFHLGRSKAYKLPRVLREPTGKRIRRIETFTKSPNLGLVRITTDDGKEGVGQLSTYDADLSAEVLHRKIARHALGQDPANLDSLVDRIVEANYKWPWSYVCRALSGLDTAVWDWLGKHESKPVCELLGGTVRRFPVYASSMSRSIQPREEADRLVRLRDDQGFRAFKVRVGKVNGRDEDQWPGRTEALIPTVRETLGDNIDLLVDGNSCYTPPRAIQVGRLLEEHQYCHFEEPCPYWELEWTAEVTRAIDVPVAGGEQDNDLAQWRRMITTHSVDIVQPDVLYLGGVVRTLRVAAMAAERGISCVPHSANRAMVTLISLHLLGAIANAGKYVEYSIEKTPWADTLYEPKLRVVDGQVAIPQAPGWGVRIREDWFRDTKRQISES
jgi:L-alanine-DL-glutamate epimerase-like enolase superfamily enzyme